MRCLRGTLGGTFGRGAIGAALLALALGIVGAGCAATASSARSGQPRVAVAGFDGRAATWEQKVTFLVEGQKRWELVSSESYAETAYRLRARRQNAADVARVAGKLDATAVIYGKLIGGKKRGKLKLTVRDGQTGEVIERVVLPVRRGKLSRTSKRLLARKLRTALADAGADQTPTPTDAPPPAPAPEPALVAAAKPAPKAVAARPAPKTVAAKPAPKTVAAKPAAKVAAKSAPVDAEPTEPIVVKTDDSGQAIDDEWPEVLNQKRKD